LVVKKLERLFKGIQRRRADSVEANRGVWIPLEAPHLVCLYSLLPFLRGCEVLRIVELLYRLVDIPMLVVD
jgi:hypothetical protein